MNLKVPNELAITSEAIEVLMEQLPASKVARLLSSWQIGTGDYLSLRGQLFENESVESLFEKAKGFEANKG